MIHRTPPCQFAERLAVMQRVFRQQRQARNGPNERRIVVELLGSGSNRTLLRGVAQAERQIGRVADCKVPWP